MSKHAILFAAAAGLVLALAPPAMAQYSTGFEAGEVPPWYNGAPAGITITGQDNWAVQFGAGFRGVYTYPGLVSWAPPSAGGAWVDYTPPAHPSGGEQFCGTTGQGREVHPAAQSGLMQVRVDFLNGPEHDYAGWQGAITSRGGPGNMAGLYTAVASNYVDPGAPPRGGDWAPCFQAWNAAGTKLVNYGLGWRYDGETGWDNLPRETWWRLGYTFDTATRRITEFYSDNLMDTAGPWIMSNPQALWDDPADDPDLGPQLTDMYILGGAAGTDALDMIGLYNVGNGQVHLWDNLDIIIVPEPATMALLAFGGLGVLIRRRRR